MAKSINPSPSGHRAIWLAILLWAGLAWSVWPGCHPAPPTEPTSDGATPENDPDRPLPPHPTWAMDIAPLFQQHCVGCHTQDRLAPFSLDTFARVKARLPSIKWSIEQRRMPPWPPAAQTDHCQPLRHSRALSTRDQQLLMRWFAQGAPEGTKRPALVAPEPPKLAWIDRTVKMSKPYLPDFKAGDDYRCFVLDPRLSQGVDLIGFSISPSATAHAHHALLFQMTPEEVKDKEATPGAGWPCYGSPGGVGTLLGTWVPGSGPTRYPETTGIQIKAGQLLVLQLHYAPSTSQPTPDQTTVSLQLARSPVSRRALLYPIYDDRFSIPPDAKGFVATKQGKAPGNAKIWGIMPHMHSLGRTLQMSLQHPDGTDTCLIDIPRWAFNWQQMYFYGGDGYITMKDTDQLTLRCTWDNTTQNTITWGDNATDEMCLGYLYATK